MSIKINTALVRQRVFFECLIIAPIIHVDAYRLTCIYDNRNKINYLKYYIQALSCNNQWRFRGRSQRGGPPCSVGDGAQTCSRCQRTWPRPTWSLRCGRGWAPGGWSETWGWARSQPAFCGGERETGEDARGTGREVRCGGVRRETTNCKMFYFPFQSWINIIIFSTVHHRNKHVNRKSKAEQIKSLADFTESFVNGCQHGQQSSTDQLRQTKPSSDLHMILFHCESSATWRSHEQRTVIHTAVH